MKKTINLLQKSNELRTIEEELDIYLEIPHIAYAEVKKEDGGKALLFTNVVVFRVMLGFPDGTKIMRERAVVPIETSENLGNEIAQIMIENGALELLAEAEKVAFKAEMPQRL